MGATRCYTRTPFYSRLATHIQRRGRVWHYRRRVPDGLRHLLPREITRTLATTSVAIARKRARLLDDQVSVLFVAARSQLVTPEEIDRLIDELVDVYLESIVREDRRERWRERDLLEAAKGRWYARDAIDSQELDDAEAVVKLGFRGEAEELAKDAGVSLDEETLSRLAWELYLVWQKVDRMLTEERERDAYGQPREPIQAILGRGTLGAATRLERPRQRSSGPSLSKAVEDYLQEESRSWVPRHAGNIRSYLRSLLEELGATTPVGKVRKDEVVTWREKLRQGRGEVTVGKYVKAAAKFFRFCMDAEWIEKSPADRLPGGNAPRDTRRPDEQRQAVADADLKAIVGGPAFARLRGGSARDRETYWAILLLTYTGARRAEVAQAGVEDVREIDGVWCLRIEPSDEPGAEKSVKTAAGRRVIPIHGDLLALGVLGYVAECRSAVSRRLFPLSARQGGDTLTRAWQSLREEVGANREATIQGLRHRVATQLKHGGVEEVRIAELLGHANASVTTGRYGKRFDVVALKEVVERIENRGPLAALFE